MNRWLSVSLLVVGFTQGFVKAQDTAYKALRTIGAQRGEKALNQVVAISGQSGRPQPVDWRISLNDRAARGGVRELDIVSGQISSERTPARPDVAGMAPIDLTKLNVDSDGAFRTAEQEASRNQVGFDSVNYRLALDADSGKPVWTLELFDYEQRPVGRVRIAAGDANVLSATDWVHDRNSVTRRSHESDEEALARPQPPPAESDNDYRQPEYRQGDRHHDSSVEDSDDQTGETVGERTNHFGSSIADFGRSVVHRTTRVFQTVGGWFQEKFTGRNTIDPKHGQDEDDEQSSDTYSRPVKPETPQR